MNILESINVFIYLVTYRPIGPGAFYVFVYVIVYNCVNVCTSHNNKPFTITIILCLLFSLHALNIIPRPVDIKCTKIDINRVHVGFISMSFKYNSYLTQPHTLYFRPCAVYSDVLH